MKSKKWKRRRANRSKVYCKYCYDGDTCAFPYYGMAPHVHVKIGNGFGTKILHRNQWPDNFIPDPEQEEYFQNTGIEIAQGTYEFCPKCGKKG